MEEGGGWLEHGDWERDIPLWGCSMSSPATVAEVVIGGGHRCITVVIKITADLILCPWEEKHEAVPLVLVCLYFRL